MGMITHEDISKALNISNDRYEYLTSYMIQMIKDYHGDITDIIKEVPLNLKGKERRFTIFILGHSSYPNFSEQGDEEKEKFITSIIDVLKLNHERAKSIADDIANTILKDTKEGEEIPTIDIIKKIIDGSLSDIEKDYALFILGMMYT